MTGATIWHEKKIWSRYQSTKEYTNKKQAGVESRFLFLSSSLSIFVVGKNDLSILSSLHHPNFRTPWVCVCAILLLFYAFLTYGFYCFRRFKVCALCRLYIKLYICLGFFCVHLVMTREDLESLTTHWSSPSLFLLIVLLWGNLKRILKQIGTWPIMTFSVSSWLPRIRTV